jgi:sec-independent protein translocase protein TatA
MNLGGPELLIVLAVILLLFGGRKLPELARSMGQAKKEFETGTRAASAPSAPGSAGEASQG